MPEPRAAAYLYAFSERGAADRAGETRGVVGMPVHERAAQGATAFVSWLTPSTRARLETPADDATAVCEHAAAVTALFEAAPLVPVRFGTIVDDAEALDRLLVDKEAEILAAVRDVRGCEEWDVRVAWDPAEARSMLEARRRRAPSGAGTADGAAYLRARRDDLRSEDQLRRLRGTVAEGVHGALACHARRAVRRGPLSGPEVLHGWYLVPRSRADAFATAVERALDGARPLGLRGRLSGPLPPYSFGRLEWGAQRGALR